MLKTIHRGTSRYPARIMKGTLAGVPVVVAAIRRSGFPVTVTVTAGAAALMPGAPGVTMATLPIKGLAAAIRTATARVASAGDSSAYA